MLSLTRTVQMTSLFLEERGREKLTFKKSYSIIARTHEGRISEERNERY